MVTKDTLTIRELAQRLGISVATIHRRRRAGVFPLQTCNRGITHRLIFAVADVDRLVHKQGTTPLRRVG